VELKHQGLAINGFTARMSIYMLVTAMDDENKWCLEHIGDEQLSVEDLSACIDVARSQGSRGALPALFKIMRDSARPMSIRKNAAWAVRAIGGVPNDMMMELKQAASFDFKELAAIALSKNEKPRVKHIQQEPDPLTQRFFSKIGLDWDEVDFDSLIVSIGGDHLLSYESQTEGNGSWQGHLDDWHAEGGMKRITMEKFLNIEPSRQQPGIFKQRQYYIIAFDEQPCLLVECDLGDDDFFEFWVVSPVAYSDDGDISLIFRTLAQILIKNFHPELIEAFAFRLDANQYHSEFSKFLGLLRSPSP